MRSPCRLNPRGSFLGGGCLTAVGRTLSPQISLAESQDSRLVLRGLSLEPGQQGGQRDPQVAGRTSTRFSARLQRIPWTLS